MPDQQLTVEKSTKNLIFQIFDQKVQIKRPIVCVYNSCVYFEDIRIVGLKFGPLGQKFFPVASFCVKANNLPRGEIVAAPITLEPLRVSDFCDRPCVDLKIFMIFSIMQILQRNFC